MDRLSTISDDADDDLCDVGGRCQTSEGRDTVQDALFQQSLPQVLDFVLVQRCAMFSADDV